METSEILRQLVPGLVLTIYIGIVFGTMFAAYWVQRKGGRARHKRGSRARNR